MEQIAGADELPMLDVYLPMMKSAAILSADELGLFRALAGGPRSVQAVAAEIGAEESALRRLCDLLAAVGYVAYGAAGTVQNTPFSERWLAGTGAHDYGPGLAWTRVAWEMMPSLTEAVRHGGPTTTLWQLMEQRPALGPLFSRYMHAFATHLSEDVLRHVAAPPGAAKMLDLGGSHGLHTLGFCRENPALHATIVDWPASLTDTPKTLAAAGVTERVQLRGGDLRTVEWGEGYDLVLYLSVAHNQSAADNAQVFSRIGRALNPGGRLVVHEYVADAPLPAYDAAFRLTLLVETGTRTWSLAELSGWCTAAGLSAPTAIPLTPREKGTLLVAHKPSGA